MAEYQDRRDQIAPVIEETLNLPERRKSVQMVERALAGKPRRHQSAPKVTKPRTLKAQVEH